MRRKAVSPVVATVILVAVVITIAVGIAYYMSMIASQYTWSFRKISVNENITKIYNFRYNCTLVYLGDDGNGWIMYDNGTHLLGKRIKASGNWEVWSEVVTTGN